MWLLAVVLASAPLAIKASVNQGALESGWVYAKAGQSVELVAVTAQKPSSLRWFKIEPTVASLDNTTPSFHFEPVKYAKTAIAACDDQPRCAVDVAPSVLPERMKGLGTMSFQVEATLANGAVLKTPGLKSVKYGGLIRDVMRVTIRRLGMQPSFRIRRTSSAARGPMAEIKVTC